MPSHTETARWRAFSLDTSGLDTKYLPELGSQRCRCLTVIHRPRLERRLQSTTNTKRKLVGFLCLRG